MVLAYYRRVRQRALADTRHALSMETRQRVVRQFLVAVLTTVVLSILLYIYDKQAFSWVRVAMSTVPILVYCFVFLIFYIWNLVAVPAKLDKEAQDKINIIEKRDDQTRNTWLYDAICRVYLGKWDLIPIERDERTRHTNLKLDANGHQAIHDLCEKVRQLAYEDRLKIWGKKPGFSTLWELINTNVWNQIKIDYVSLSYGDPKKVKAVPMNTSGQLVAFQELMTTREAIDDLCRSDAFNFDI